MKALFRRPLPDDPRYRARLAAEMAVIEARGFESYFERVVEILALTSDVPHVTRGSAASSLVCYLLGISQIDPVREGIRMERFLHRLREDVPDVDLDFPWHVHKQIHERVLMRWPGRAARVSNHIHFRERGAWREALRRLGYKNEAILSEAQRARARQLAATLVGTRKGYSKHVGGVVVLDSPIPREDLLTPTQLRLDKREVARRGWWKIDLLSSRALGQLKALDGRPLHAYPEHDVATSALLCRGDVLGVTQGESPAFRKIVRAIRPRGRRDVALALALLRPAAASRGRKARFLRRWRQGRVISTLVFEDDATDLIASVLGCDHAEADLYRRAFAKGDKARVADFMARLGDNPRRRDIVDDLSQLRAYSFCKAHALALGHVVWALAYHKAHDPARFWWAALNHCASMYRPWVHIQEAKRAGWVLVGEGAPWRMDGVRLLGARRQTSLFEASPAAEYVRQGWWSRPGFLPGLGLSNDGDEVTFRGLIATGRPYRTEAGESVSFISIGTGARYLDLVIEGRASVCDADAVFGRGLLRSSYGAQFVEVIDHQLMRVTSKGFKCITEPT